MSKTSLRLPPANAGFGYFCSRLLQPILFLVLGAALILRAADQAQTPDDQYLNIYGIIQQADSLSSGGQADAAKAKYQQAQTALERLQTSFPGWNVRMVGFRLEYVAQKLAELPAKTPAGNTNSAPASEGPTSGAGAANSATSAGGVKLLEAGAEPRKKLRLHPKVGDKQTMLMTLKMSIATKVGAAEMPVAMPPMKMTMDMTVKNISPAGDINYEMLMTDATVATESNTPPQVAQTLQASLGKMKGLSGNVTISDRGQTKDLQLQTPPGADPQTSQMLEQMRQTFSSLGAPLPEEEVGLGARWEARMPIKSGGMTIDQTATYQLTALEGDRLTASATVNQRASNQKFENPAMPAMKTELTKMTGHGSGTLTVDLGQVVPREGKMDYHSDLSMTISAGQQKQNLSMKIDLNVQFEGK